MKFSDAMVTVRLDIIETTIGTSPIMCLFGGSMPDTCEAADAGAALSQGTLPADWMRGATDGSKGKFGNWTITGTAAASTGTQATHFRIKTADGTVTHIQGTVGPTVAATQTGTWFSAGVDVALANPTPAIVKGMSVTGLGIHLGTVVVSVPGLGQGLPPPSAGIYEAKMSAEERAPSLVAESRELVLPITVQLAAAA